MRENLTRFGNETSKLFLPVFIIDQYESKTDMRHVTIETNLPAKNRKMRNI